MIDEQIETLLKSKTPITDIAEDRIYPVIPTENAQPPFVVFTVDLTDSTHALQGAMGFYTYTLTIDCLAINHKNALRLAQACRQALDGHRDNVLTQIFLQSTSQPVLDTGYQYQVSFEVRSRI